MAQGERVLGVESLRMSSILLLDMIDLSLYLWLMLDLILMLVSFSLLLYLHLGWIISIRSLLGLLRELKLSRILRILSVMIMTNLLGKLG